MQSCEQPITMWIARGVSKTHQVRSLNSQHTIRRGGKAHQARKVNLEGSYQKEVSFRTAFESYGGSKERAKEGREPAEKFRDQEKLPESAPTEKGKMPQRKLTWRR